MAWSSMTILNSLRLGRCHGEMITWEYCASTATGSFVDTRLGRGRGNFMNMAYVAPLNVGRNRAGTIGANGVLRWADVRGAPGTSGSLITDLLAPAVRWRNEMIWHLAECFWRSRARRPAYLLITYPPSLCTRGASPPPPPPPFFNHPTCYLTQRNNKDHIWYISIVISPQTQSLFAQKTQVSPLWTTTWAWHLSI
jgi:hypothetical protein